MQGNEKRVTSEEQRDVDICALINIYTSENHHTLALLLATVDTEDLLLSRFNMEKAAITMAITVSQELIYICRLTLGLTHPDAEWRGQDLCLKVLWYWW